MLCSFHFYAHEATSFSFIHKYTSYVIIKNQKGMWEKKIEIVRFRRDVLLEVRIQHDLTQVTQPN